MPGPVPNRSDDLARPRERKGKEIQPVTKGRALPVEIPTPDSTWHPIARMLWDSLALSGQSDFYQQSDWAIAYSICDDLSEYKNPKRRWNKKTQEWEEYTYRSGQMLQTIMSALSNLLVTEGDRRRVRVELTDEQPNENPAHLVVMADYREGLGIDDD